MSHAEGLVDGKPRRGRTHEQGWAHPAASPDSDFGPAHVERVWRGCGEGVEEWEMSAGRSTVHSSQSTVQRSRYVHGALKEAALCVCIYVCVY